MQRAASSRLVLPILVSSLLLAGCGPSLDDQAVEASVATCRALGHEDPDCHTSFVAGFDAQMKQELPLTEDQVRAAWGESEAEQLGYVAGINFARDHR